MTGFFDGIDLAEAVDLTLPPHHIKIFYGEVAAVYRFDLEQEVAVLVASWPERSVRRPDRASPDGQARLMPPGR